MNKEKWIQCALGMGLDEFEIYQDESFEKGISWMDLKPAILQEHPFVEPLMEKWVLWL